MKDYIKWLEDIEEKYKIPLPLHLKYANDLTTNKLSVPEPKKGEVSFYSTSDLYFNSPVKPISKIINCVKYER